MSFPVKARLDTILGLGILSGDELARREISHERSYNAKSNESVFFNVIPNRNGIDQVVHHLAEGILCIGMERQNDKERILSMIDQNEVERIYKEATAESSSMVSFYADFIRENARNQHLSENPKLIYELESRLHRTAVCILDLKLTQQESESVRKVRNYCALQRESIRPEEIKTVIVSEKLKGTPELEEAEMQQKVSFAPVATLNNITFTFREGPMITQIQNLTLQAPNFQKALEDMLWESFPLALHTTRI